MKTLMYFMVMVAGFASHAAINHSANSSCNERAKVNLWDATAKVEEKKPSPVQKQHNPAPGQQAQAQSKAQST